MKENCSEEAVLVIFLIAVMLELGKWRQEDQKSRVELTYIVSSRLAWTTRVISSKQKKNSQGQRSSRGCHFKRKIVSLKGRVKQMS